MQANKDNIVYYNQIYENLKSEKGKLASLARLEMMRRNQPGVFRRVFCCAKRNLMLEEEDVELEEVVYSSGESGDEEAKLGRQFLKMKERDKQKRIRTLWYKMLAKAKGAVLILDRFTALTRRIYLFGTSHKLQFQIEEDPQPGALIILPDSYFRLFWNIIVLILLLYTGIFTPYRTAFVENDDPDSFLFKFEIFIDSMYCLDLFMNFLMAYEDQDKKIEVRWKKIAANYLRTWFFLDFISCIPYQYFEPPEVDSETFTVLIEPAVTAPQPQGQLSRGICRSSHCSAGQHFLPEQPPALDSTQQSLQIDYIQGVNSNSVVKTLLLTKMVRILRLMKLIRLVKYNRSINKILQGMKMNQGVKRMISVTITMLFLVHLMGCTFYIIAMFNEFDPECWVVRLGKQEEEPFMLYLYGINWALQTLTTVGYGDINAKMTTERTVALIWMIFGVGFYSFTIGNLASIISAIDKRAAHL